MFAGDRQHALRLSRSAGYQDAALRFSEQQRNRGQVIRQGHGGTARLLAFPKGTLSQRAGQPTLGAVVRGLEVTSADHRQNALLQRTFGEECHLRRCPRDESSGHIQILRSAHFIRVLTEEHDIVALGLEC